jgi:hypothetical protein
MVRIPAREQLTIAVRTARFMGNITTRKLEISVNSFFDAGPVPGDETDRFPYHHPGAPTSS